MKSVNTGAWLYKLVVSLPQKFSPGDFLREAGKRGKELRAEKRERKGEKLAGDVGNRVITTSKDSQEKTLFL